MSRAAASLELAKRIAPVASVLDDDLSTYLVAKSCFDPQRMLYSQPDVFPHEWYYTAIDLSRQQRNLLIMSMAAAMGNQLSRIRSFRVRSSQELQELPEIGLGRTAILKAFGEPLSTNVIEDILPKPGYL